jgi:hypothetical protein
MQKGKRLKGVRIPVDLSSPDAAKLAAQVDELNAFFSPVEIKPDGAHYAFQRVFNQGDLPGFAWNKGGRLISMGQSYQQMSQEDRRKITINGEETVEIDLRASHLTILYAKLGLRFDPAGPDPYQVTDIPRDVVKAWVTQTLGHDRFQRCWSKPNKEKYRSSNRGTGDLQKDYPIRLMKEKIPAHLPVLSGWETCPIRWGDLQYVESCAVVDTVYELATKHNIPALPVHDSIIVAASQQEIAVRVLEECFERQVGVRPALSIK